MKPIIVLMLHLVVPWLCLALLPAASASADAELLKDYPQVMYSTASATPDKYNTFIASVRALLVSKGKATSNGIPVLLSKDDPDAIQTSLNVTLTNKAGYSVSLRMEVTGAYFSAYVAGKYTCSLIRSGDAFSSAACYNDPWAISSPTPVQSAAGDVAGDDGLEAVASRWGAKDLDKAVSTLYLYPSGNATEQDLINAIATCDMMIASAAKFPYIQRRMSAGMSNGVSDDASLNDLQARWPTFSTAVQEAFQGVLASTVTVKRSNGKSMRVDNVRTAVPLVSFLEYDNCKIKTKAQQLSMLIRSVVEEADILGIVGGGGARTCSQAEPTMRIVGPEGRCLDVPYNWYYIGNQVQLWSCKSYDDANQLWTFKRDGTIRSNGKCLTSSSNSAGAKVVIDNCPSSPSDRTVWEVRVDGTIALKSCGLVLSVTSSALYAGVTVRLDDRGTGQSWTPTNDTTALSAPIVGYRDLCLQVDSAWVVSLGTCGNGMDWALYPDGSLRPPARLLFQWQCLAADASSGRVTLKYCDGSGSACERWVFRSDGTILNTGTGKVLDVKPSASKKGSYDVVVSAATGKATQQWAIML